MYVIKGQSIDKMLQIRDTTPGIQSLLIMAVMLLLIYALFQYTMLIINTKKIEELRHYEYVFKKALNEKNNPQRKTGRRNNVGTKEQPVKRRERTERDYLEAENEAEKEAMEIFNNLRR